jgi:hypothetical protein
MDGASRRIELRAGNKCGSPAPDSTAKPRDGSPGLSGLSLIDRRFPTYTQFFNRIQPGKTMGNFPYQTHFNEIAKEERELG